MTTYSLYIYLVQGQMRTHPSSVELFKSKIDVVIKYLIR
ncbi:hypothetical protein F891_01223 [Acinetobacter sp. CIP 101966]|nr:hypothetical protein F891_01223 [Acinetobacter sp. CIP 101966]